MKRLLNTRVDPDLQEEVLAFDNTRDWRFSELHTEVVKLRELLDEHRVREVELQQSETRAWRRVESAERSAAETHERCERRIEAEIERVEACRHCRLRAPASTRPAAHHHHCHHTTCSRARPRRKCGAAPGRTRRARLRSEAKAM